MTYRDIAHQNNAKTSDIHKEIRYVISSCIHLYRELIYLATQTATYTQMTLMIQALARLTVTRQSQAAD